MANTHTCIITLMKQIQLYKRCVWKNFVESTLIIMKLTLEQVIRNVKIGIDKSLLVKQQSIVRCQGNK